jgi:hypothetical protein
MSSIFDANADSCFAILELLKMDAHGQEDKQYHKVYISGYLAFE